MNDNKFEPGCKPNNHMWQYKFEELTYEDRKLVEDNNILENTICMCGKMIWKGHAVRIDK